MDLHFLQKIGFEDKGVRAMLKLNLKPFIPKLNKLLHNTAVVTLVLVIFEGIVLAVSGPPRTTWNMVQHLMAFEFIAGIYLAALIVTLKPVQTGNSAKVVETNDMRLIAALAILFIGTIAVAMSFSSKYQVESAAICGTAVIILIISSASCYFFIKNER